MNISSIGPNGDENIHSMLFAATTKSVALLYRSSIYNCSNKLSSVAFKLVPGSISQTVQVTSDEISLNTTAPEISTTLEPELVKTLPIEINGGPRVVDSFLSQIPGIQNGGTSLGQRTYQFSGGQTTLTAPYINGVPLAVAANQTLELPFRAE